MQKNFFEKICFLLASMMKIAGSGSADPDPLVRGIDPRIRIQIHIKMSWIRNTAKNHPMPYQI
jgi:hypothetical protein